MKLIQLSNEDYHANRTHVSKSWLDKIERSPAHLKAYLDSKYPEEDTKSLIFGKGFHALILEPDVFYQTYTVAPECDRRTKDGKQTYADFLANNAGKQIIEHKDYITAENMIASARSNKYCMALLSKGSAEQSVFFKDESGVDCKARADFLKENFIVDVKTTDDASERGFLRSIKNYRYDVQAVHYQNGFQIDRFVFIAIEKKPPYALATYMIDDGSMYEASENRKRNLDTYAECLVKNEWPGYSEGIKIITL